ncbi:hypothetical protein [Streptomyces misionensis]|uniref:hypothetical protein n=1 Tax=Streptomyces misionensis TaxID=67331 RepID=UPI003BAFE7C2
MRVGSASAVERGELRRGAEQRKQPAPAVGRCPYEQRAQLGEAVLALAEERERDEQLVEIAACADGCLPVGATGVQVREQELIPIAGQDRRFEKPRPRRSFTPEFKAEIVELCRRGAST